MGGGGAKRHGTLLGASASATPRRVFSLVGADLVSGTVLAAHDTDAVRTTLTCRREERSCGESGGAVKRGERRGAV